MTTPNAPKIFKSLIILLVSAIALFVLYIYIALSWSYSSGERAGFLQKVSNKGWICKTWEGELSLVAMPGAAPEKFLFTVRDEAIAQKVSAAAGKRVTLNYEQHKGLPSSCFGDTDYFVVDVKEIE
jgi:flagellar basal body-associated protein FliL